MIIFKTWTSAFFMLLIQILLIAQSKQQLAFRTTDQLRAGLEKQIITFSSFISGAYRQRCINPIIRNCDIKSVDVCVGTRQQTCLKNIPSFPQCKQPGARVSMFSGVRYIKRIDELKLSQEDELFICSSALIQETWNVLYNRIKEIVPMQYFASQNGYFRQKPGWQIKDQNNNCYQYDPRLRPWYATAISNSKNILIVVPFSESINKLGNLIRIKQAVKTILGTLSRNDFVNIFLYNQKTLTIDPRLKGLHRASEQKLKNFVKLVEILDSPGLKVDFKQVFTKILEVFKKVEADDLGAPCPTAQNLVLFFADSTQENSTVQQLLNHIESIRGVIQITIFTYQLPSQHNSSLTLILKHLSCSYNGIYFKLTTNAQQNALDVVSYFNFLSEGLDQRQIKPSWSTPYTDFSGFGRVITLAYPAFITQQIGGVRVRKLLGVSGMDVRISVIQILFPYLTEQVIQSAFISFSCANSSIFRKEPCKLQNIRPQNAKCSQLKQPFGYQQYRNCPQVPKIISCPLKNDVKVLTIPIDYSSDVCCYPSAVGAIVGATVGAFAAFLVFGFIAVLIFRKLKRKQKLQQQNLNSNQNAEIDVPHSQTRFPRDGDILTKQQRENIIAIKFGNMHQ